MYVCQNFQTSSPRKTTGPIKAEFHVEPSWGWGMKVSSNGPGHTTKMATMPRYGKTLNNLLLRNQQADDLRHRQAQNCFFFLFFFCRLLYNNKHKPSRAFISTNKSKFTIIKYSM